MVAKVDKLIASFTNFSRWLHLNNLFYKTSMITPFVKPRQVFSYLDWEVSETCREIVTLLRPYIFAKRTAIDSRKSILSV